MFRFGNENENLFPSITENCETLFDQTHTRPQETLVIRITQLRKLSHLNLPLNLVLTLNG